jgi:hypothetical protein
MQNDLKTVKNAVSPDFPKYMINNPNYNIRASSNPRDQLSTGNGMPGTIAVGTLNSLESEGRSPMKSAAQTARHGKRAFPGFRMAMSKDFPDLMGHKQDSHSNERCQSPSHEGNDLNKHSPN